MQIKVRLITGVLAGALALGLVSPAANATAAQGSNAIAATSEARSEAQLAESLEVLFEEVLVIDANGIVAFNEARAADLLGEVEAARLGDGRRGERRANQYRCSVQQRLCELHG